MANTYTCSVFKGNVAKMVFKGDQSLSGVLLWVATSGVGDIGLMAKVPHGATITDFWEYHTGVGVTVKWGFDRGVANGGGAGLSCLTAAVATATKNTFSPAAWKAVAGNIAPATISLSDTDPVRYAVLRAQVAAGTVAGVKVWFMLTYRMDGPQPRPAGAQADMP